MYVVCVCVCSQTLHCRVQRIIHHNIMAIFRETGGGAGTKDKINLPCVLHRKIICTPQINVCITVCVCVCVCVFLVCICSVSSCLDAYYFG